MKQHLSPHRDKISTFLSNLSLISQASFPGNGGDRLAASDASDAVLVMCSIFTGKGKCFDGFSNNYMY
jgi:hypothetical protein